MPRNQRYVYIVLTQTGSALSGFLKQVTHAPFNHVSLSLKPDLSEMFSFGRRRPFNPFIGGFVMEAPRKGTFQRFPETEALVIRRPITEQQYRVIKQHFDGMYRIKDRYHYNFTGLALAAFGVSYRGPYKFYCSEFVRHVLINSGVTAADEFPKVVKPMDFLRLKDTRRVYRGKLKDYSVDPLVRRPTAV